MIDKAERVFDSLNRADIVRLLALDHDHRDIERAGGGDLAIGGGAAAVLGDDHVDPVFNQQFPLVALFERTGRENVMRFRNFEPGCDGIDAADQIAMLRRAFEMERFLPADGKEDAFRAVAESLDCVCDGANIGPVVSRFRLPCRAPQRKKRNSGLARRDGGVVRDARRKGMRGIDQKVEFFSRQETGKSVAATEAAATCRHRLGHRFCRASGQRKQAVAIGATGQRGGQLSCFGRAAKDQDAVFAHG